MINAEQLKGIASGALIGIGTLLVGRNFISQEQLNQLVDSAPKVIDALGTISTLAGFIWSIYRNSQGQQIAKVQRLVSNDGLSVKVQAAVLEAAAPLASSIVAKNQAVADAAPSPKIVAPVISTPLNANEAAATQEENK